MSQKKENGITLKAFPRDYKKKCVATITNSKDEEKLTLLIKNINIYLKNGRRSDQRRNGKKKAMKSTSWDSDSESEVVSTHMCFMVQGYDHF